jgi:hypothetical protein
MFYAIAPFEFKSEQLVVDVETEGTITTGTMVIEVLLLMPQCSVNHFRRYVTGVDTGNASK